MANREILTHQWQSLWTQVSLFYFSFFYIPLIAIVIASLWSSEHKTGLKFIRMSPKKNMAFITAKIILALIIISLCQIYFLILFYMGGKFIGNFSRTDFGIYFYYIILSIFLAIPIIAIFSSFAIRIKSFGISILAIEAYNFRFINSYDFILLGLFAIGEFIIFIYLSNKFLRYENK